MARKKIRRRLRPLRGKLKLSRVNVKTEQLSDILRKAARKQQTKKPQVFYALREVADRFDVSLSMVAAVYRQLEGEGLLTRLRGSRTLLKGVDAGRQVAVHAIVGVPMSLSSFLTRQKSRMFFMCTRRELRRRGFMTAGLFYETAEARPDLLLERIKHCKVDSVLWYRPDQCARETARLLHDSGVGVIGVADGGLPALPCRFEISRQKAVAEILGDWKTRGTINRVSVIHTARRSAVEEERLEALLETTRLDYDFVDAERGHCDALLHALEEKEQGGIILLGDAASLFAFRAPDRLTALMNRRRVALVDGPLSLPFANTPAVRADLAVADWEAVASGITDGILTGEAFLPAGTTVFDATAYLQAPLSEFAQTV
jgi:DNA-binding MarR family transcriptional regulator